MNWWWTIFHSKFKLHIPYIIIIPWIVRKSTLIDATKLPPLFEGVSSSTREDTFCGKLVERGFQNRELSDAEEGLKELEGKTIKWHSTEGGGGGDGSFRLQTSFGIHGSLSIPSELCPRSWRSLQWNRRFAQLSKKTCCRSRKSNLTRSQKFLFYIYIIYFTSNLIIFLIKKKKMWIRERNLSWKYFEIINNKRRSKFIIIIHSLFIPWLLIVNK